MRHPAVQGEIETEDKAGRAVEPSVRWSALQQLLATSGEALATSEAASCLEALLGGGGPALDGDTIISSSMMAATILNKKG